MSQDHSGVSGAAAVQDAEVGASAELEQFDPKAPEVLHAPYPIFHRYREADPVHWGVAGLAGFPGAWYLFRHEDGIRTLKDDRLGKQRRTVTYSGGGGDPSREDGGKPPVPEAAKPFFQLASNFLVHQDPPDHTRLRSLVSKAFTPRAVEAMRPRIVELTDQLIDGVEDRAEMDFITDFAFPLPVAVISDMLGLPEEARDLFARWSRTFQEVDVRTTEETWKRAGRSVAEARSYIGDLIEERRRVPREDLVSALIEAEREGDKLTKDELVGNILFLFVAGAGFETTTGLIGNGLLALLRNPDQMELLRSERKWLGSAVEELLRYESPIQMTNRVAHEDLEVRGRRIREGDSVLIVIAAANRDPEVFPEPDALRIDREENRHYAFGQGIHYCLGGPLARLEAEVAFDRLLDRLPRLALADADPIWSDNAAIRVLRSLPVRF